MENKIEELTLLLLYLTSWDEKGFYYNEETNMPEEKIFKQSWKGYSFDALNSLTDKEYLFFSKNKNKSVTLTPEGEKLAKELEKKYLKENS